MFRLQRSRTSDGRKDRPRILTIPVGSRPTREQPPPPDAPSIRTCLPAGRLWKLFRVLSLALESEYHTLHSRVLDFLQPAPISAQKAPSASFPIRVVPPPSMVNSQPTFPPPGDGDNSPQTFKITKCEKLSPAFPSTYDPDPAHVRELSALFSIPSAHSCAFLKITLPRNPFIFYRLRTFSDNYRGWGYPSLPKSIRIHTCPVIPCASQSAIQENLNEAPHDIPVVALVLGRRALGPASSHAPANSLSLRSRFPEAPGRHVLRRSRRRRR